MIDWSRVEELVCEIGADDFGEVVELFLEEVDGAIASLDPAEGPQTLQQTFHLIKGCAWNLGFSELGELCAQQEETTAIVTEATIAHLAEVYSTSRTAFMAGLKARSIDAPAA